MLHRIVIVVIIIITGEITFRSAAAAVAAIVEAAAAAYEQSDIDVTYKCLDYDSRKNVRSAALTVTDLAQCNTTLKGCSSNSSSCNELQQKQQLAEVNAEGGGVPLSWRHHRTAQHHCQPATSLGNGVR